MTERPFEKSWVELSGHLALSRRLGFTPSLDRRTSLIAAQLAAELSGCGWCIERGRHDWRNAGLPSILLPHLRRHAASSLFDERERAALAFVQAATRPPGCASGVPEPVIAQARRFFSEVEIAELTRCLADHHFLDDSLR